MCKMPLPPFNYLQRQVKSILWKQYMASSFVSQTYNLSTVEGADRSQFALG